MKILFSIYSEDHDTEEKTLIYSRTVETKMKISEIDTLLQLYDGFHSVLEVGHNLCFWDIYCFFADADDLQKKIATIPTDVANQTEDYSQTKVLIIEQFDPGDTDDSCYPNEENCFVYRLTRYECGASGFEAIATFASNHPWLMVFISGAIWDLTKFLGIKLRKRIKGRFGLVSETGKSKRVACLSVKHFYRNFSKLTGVSANDCQIVHLNRRKNNVYDVRVRTVNNEAFHVKCNSRGKIDSLKIVDLNALHKKF